MAASETFETTKYLATAGLGRKILHLPSKGCFFSQGSPSDAVFFLHKGRARLTVVGKAGKTATITLLNEGDFIGEEAVAGIPGDRLATATALTACSALRITRKEMIRVLHEEHDFSDFFLTFVLARSMRTQADLVDQLFNSSEKRLARILLLMAQFGHSGKPQTMIPDISQETLADMIGTTRSRVSFFMNRFRKLGFIEYNGRIHVNPSLLNVVLHDQISEENAEKPAPSCYPETFKIRTQDRSSARSDRREIKFCRNAPECIDLTIFYPGGGTASIYLYEVSAMHNCPSEPMQDRSPKSAQSLVSTAIAFQPALVLLVEPHGSMHSPKILLGTDKRYCVIDIHTVPEIVDLRDENISVAVLSVALGWPVLRSAATSVRRQWPSAKILLQGRVGTDFDDHLYETAADSSTDPADFMRALDSMANQKAVLQSESERKVLTIHGPSKVGQPSIKSGLSREMSSIRSPYHGAWNKLMGVQRP